MSTVVFDGDDTLWNAEWKYSQACADFFSFLYTALGRHVPNLHFIYKVFFDHEDRNGKTLGIRRGRVALSMQETYQDICEWVKNYGGQDVYRKEHVERIKTIGDQPFDVTQHHWIPGAEQTLQELLNRGHELCLLTKYDRNMWPQKAAALRTDRFFSSDRTLTVDGRKEIKDFLAISRAAQKPGQTLFTVGNSEGDLIAAQALENWRGFYIPLASSVPLEKDTRPKGQLFEPTPIDHPRVTSLKSITEILQHF